MTAVPVKKFDLSQYRSRHRPSDEEKKLIRRFGKDSKLSWHQKKFCSCFLDRLIANPTECTKDLSRKETSSGKTCYNPFAICYPTLKGEKRADCGPEYDYDALNKEELYALALYFKIEGVTKSKTAVQLRRMIKNWKKTERKS